jgi:signal peptidase I
MFGVCMSVTLWIILQVFFFTSFKIPTDSMEPALLPGDNIIVNKLAFGARLFNLFDAAKQKPIHIIRMYGFERIKRNDVLVFNFPYPKERNYIAFDLMKYYVKRCVALPRDTFLIVNGYYQVKGCSESLGNIESQREVLTLLGPKTDNKFILNGYPHDSLLNWNIRNFGPLYVPAKGSVVTMNHTNAILYKQLIEYEQNMRITISGDTVFLNNHPIKWYQFRKNYYFMAGDKSRDSQDSRYWGLLPEEFIVGKATFIWKSLEPRTGKWRWERLFKLIE